MSDLTWILDGQDRCLPVKKGSYAARISGEYRFESAVTSIDFWNLLGGKSPGNHPESRLIP